MRIARLIAASMAVLCVCLMVTSANAVEGPFTLSDSPTTANATTFVYDPDSGNMSTNNGGGKLITTFQVKSAGTKFIPEGLSDPSLISPPFDVLTAEKLFKLSTDGFDNIQWGAIYPAGMTADALMEDLLVDGSFFGGGDLAGEEGGGPFLNVVPEPSSIALLGLGFVGLLGLRRRS